MFLQKLCSTFTAPKGTHMSNTSAHSETPKKILFITPFFGRTGSEMQLLYILENLSTAKFQPFLYARNDGALLKELPPYVKSFIGYKKHKNYLLRLFRLLLYAVNINPIEFQLRIIQRKIKADCWYINTIANRDAYRLAVKLGIKVISHVHEMPLYFNMVKQRTIKDLLHSETCIGCSSVVCEILEDMGHRKVKLLHSFVDDRFIKLNNSTSTLASEFNFKTTDFIWIIAGTVNSLKGVDFVIPLLKVLKSNHKIIWLGSIEDSGTTAYSLIAGKHFKDRLFFVGKKTTDYYDYFNIGHAFLSLSRQDSFPLVMQEAAHLGKPIAGFNSGGIAEYVKPEIGIVVNQLSFIDLATAMESIEENYISYNKDSIKAYAKTYNAIAQTKKLELILTDFLSH